MSDIVIRVEGLSKAYQIGVAQKSYDTLGEQLVDFVKAPFRRAGKLLRGQATGAAGLDETIWALKDVSFEVKRGEVVGIVGRNGAGKSTLLKILSRITDPTSGQATIYGRVSSLLEVGTGFHPELTGRENIYLNGAILGMRKAEIVRNFDEIVAFAEIGKFIDTPVKHYSSGMYVRLAFSVAAHLNTEILLVDEVLAVGDVAFQRKCLGKMSDVAGEGRTVLFVSHNMGVMQTLCQRGILLEDGHIVADAGVSEAINTYLQALEDFAFRDVSERTDRSGKGRARLVGVEVIAGTNGASSTLKTGNSARFVFHVDKSIPFLGCRFSLFDQLGQQVAVFASHEQGLADSYDSTNGSTFVCEVDPLLLLPGRYRLDVAVLSGLEVQDHVEAVEFIEVSEGQVAGRPAKSHQRVRVTFPHRWTLPGSRE